MSGLRGQQWWESGVGEDVLSAITVSSSCLPLTVFVDNTVSQLNG